MPGVHAHAAERKQHERHRGERHHDGDGASARQPTSRSGCRPLDAQPLALSPHGPPEIAQLGLDDVIDRLLRLAE